MSILRFVLHIRAHSAFVLRPKRPFNRLMSTTMNGDLNNTAAERLRTEIATDPAYNGLSLAITASEDDAKIRSTYRGFLLDDKDASEDWVAALELSTILKMVDTQVLQRGGDRLKILVLHGSMRQRYYTMTHVVTRSRS
jgi:arsenic resistance protein ArsH